MLRFVVAATALFLGSTVVTADRQNLPPDSKLRIETLTEGDCSITAKSGDNVSVHYRGSLYRNGKEFDASYNRGQPFEFPLGKGRVIKGWDKGVNGMCIGEKRKLIIPSDMGYGSRGAGRDIQGGDTLVFEVELLSVNGKTEL